MMDGRDRSAFVAVRAQVGMMLLVSRSAVAFAAIAVERGTPHRSEPGQKTTGGIHGVYRTPYSSCGRTRVDPVDAAINVLLARRPRVLREA
jgi:hypothetical protein